MPDVPPLKTYQLFNGNQAVDSMLEACRSHTVVALSEWCDTATVMTLMLGQPNEFMGGWVGVKQ